MIKDNQDGSRLHRSTAIEVRDPVYKPTNSNQYLTVKTIDKDKTGLRQHITIALMLMLATQVAADSPTPSLKGAYVEFPPLSYTNDNGKPAGSYIKRVNELADRAGYRIQWRSLPVDRVFLYIREGNIDFWLGSSRVPALGQWTREPDFSFPPIHLNAYYSRNTPDIEKPEDLKGESLILIRGYTYKNRLEPITEHPKTRVGKAPDHQAALRMLKARRGNYLINFKSPMESALAREPIQDIKKHQLTHWDTGLVFSKQVANLDQIIRDFESAWQAMNGQWTGSLTPRTSRESPTQATGANSGTPGAGDTPRDSTTGPG